MKLLIPLLFFLLPGIASAEFRAGSFIENLLESSLDKAAVQTTCITLIASDDSSSNNHDHAESEEDEEPDCE